MATNVRHDSLHLALAVGVLAHDLSASVVLHAAGKKLRGRGGVGVDQDDQRQLVGIGLPRTNEELVAIAADPPNNGGISRLRSRRR